MPPIPELRKWRQKVQFKAFDYLSLSSLDYILSQKGDGESYILNTVLTVPIKEFCVYILYILINI